MTTLPQPTVLEPTDYVPETTLCGHNRPKLVAVWINSDPAAALFPAGQRWLQFGCRRWWCRWRGNYPADFGTWFESGDTSSASEEHDA